MTCDASKSETVLGLSTIPYSPENSVPINLQDNTSFFRQVAVLHVLEIGVKVFCSRPYQAEWVGWKLGSRGLGSWTIELNSLRQQGNRLVSVCWVEHCCKL